MEGKGLTLEITTTAALKSVSLASVLFFDTASEPLYCSFLPSLWNQLKLMSLYN